VASVAGKMLLSQNQKRMNTVRGTGRNRREEIAQNDTGGEPTKQDLGFGKLGCPRRERSPVGSSDMTPTLVLTEALAFVVVKKFCWRAVSKNSKEASKSSLSM